jgi:transcriptional regulator with XRE-family HTH domain
MSAITELRELEEKIKEIEEAKELLRRKAAEIIVQLTSGMPRWTVSAIADKVGLSKAAISKIKKMDPRMGLESIKKVLETDF